MADALRVTGGVSDRQRAPLRRPEQREPLQPGRVDDGLEIGDEHVERGIGGFAIREAAAAGVVAIEPVARAERVEPGPPHRRLPVLADVGQPVGRLHERNPGAVAVDGVREPRAVGRAREPDLLLERRHCAAPDCHVSVFLGVLRSLDRSCVRGPLTVPAQRRRAQGRLVARRAAAGGASGSGGGGQRGGGRHRAPGGNAASGGAGGFPAAARLARGWGWRRCRGQLRALDRRPLLG